MADFLPLLVELGTEELPPKALPELAQAFHDGVLKGLAARRIEVRAEARDQRSQQRPENDDKDGMHGSLTPSSG